MRREFKETEEKMEYAVLVIGIIFLIGIESRDTGDQTVSEEHRILKRNAKTCHDRYAAISGHTMCLSERKHHPVSATIRKAIVDKHNDLRSKVTPAASNMMKMSYSDVLEEESQIWAEQCKMSHDHNIQRFLPGLYHVGQNIATSPSEITWDAVVQLWYDEYKKFTYGNKKYNYLDIGHYTQVVWATTSLIGCGVHKCGDTYYYVCNYGPSGNMGSLDRPYTNGTSCGDCAGHCDGTLCDCGNKVCLNDGVLNLKTCDCQCNNKVKHYDTSKCELYCEKNGDNKLCGVYPFDKGSCATNSAATMNCPWLCNICPYAGTNYTDGDFPLPSSEAASLQWNMLSTYLVTIYAVLTIC